MKDVFDVSDLDNTCTQETCENWDSLHHLMLISELKMLSAWNSTPKKWQK